jgi:hypothetical protein
MIYFRGLKVSSVFLNLSLFHPFKVYPVSPCNHSHAICERPGSQKEINALLAARLFFLIKKLANRRTHIHESIATH